MKIKPEHQMTYEELRTEYVATMRKIEATDPRLPEWDRLWDHINQIMYEWKQGKEARQ